MMHIRKGISPLAPANILNEECLESVLCILILASENIWLFFFQLDFKYRKKVKDGV